MRLMRLAETGTESLRPILEEERKAWVEHLQWDCRPALDLVTRFIDSGTLAGYAIHGDNGPAGYSYFVADRPVAFVGSLFISRRLASTAGYRQLLEKVVRTIRRIAGIKRIESQVFPFNTPLEPLFVELGFESIRRYFLSAGTGSTPPKRAHGEFWIRRWDPRRLRDAGGVIFDSYLEAPDQWLCRDYQSRAGCLRFVRNIVDNPACGVFDAPNSLLAEDESGRLCGVLLASRIQDETGMVPQLSVRRSAQGRGLGSQLLSRYLKNSPRSGIRQVTLSVSEPNQKAYRLYRRFGFEISREFHAFVWEKESREEEKG